MNDLTGSSQPSVPDPAEIARLFPAYQIEGLIGTGRSGAVYKARQVLLDRDVAIRILPKNFAEDSTFRSRFTKSVKALGRLNHPNLISIYDFGDTEGLLFVLMEFVSGGPLSRLIYEMSLPPEEVVRIMAEICDGLACAHENGIIHRDLNPANILLTPENDPKIGDFGISPRTGAATTETRPYAAPELLADPENADVRTDVYSVGVMLNELLTGSLPSVDPRPPSVATGCDPRFDAIVRHAIHPSPNMRYPDAAALGKDLHELAESLAESHPRTPLISGARTTTARPKLIANDARRKQPQPTTPPATTARLLTPASSPPRTTSKIPNLSLQNTAQKQARPVVKTTQPPQKVPAIPATPARTRRSVAPWVVALCLCIAIAGVLFLLLGGGSHSSPESSPGPMQTMPKTAPPAPSAPNTHKPGRQTPAAAKSIASRETPLEALERLRTRLFVGNRDQMPPTAEKHGESWFLLVPKPMCFDQAVSFAEKHGGHLALPESNDDLSWLAHRINKQLGYASAWLGAARNAAGTWIMLDGSSWKPEHKPNGRGAYASITNLELVRAKSGATSLPFFIQWPRNGSNRVRFDSLLSRTRETLHSSNPFLPPGSIRFRGNLYLIIQRPATWEEAEEIAQDAGANLLVISDLEEAFWFEDLMSQRKPAGKLWLGATLADDGWKWVTGEKWKTERWAEGQPDRSGPPAALLADATGKWFSADPSQPSNGFVVEWRIEEEARENDKAPPATGNQHDAKKFGQLLASLRKKAAELVARASAVHEKALASNAEKFVWDLNVWYRSLPRGAKARWAKHLQALKDKVENNRVPIEIDPDEHIEMSEKMARIAAYSAEKQNKIDESYTRELERIQKLYLDRLAKMLEEASQANDRAAADEIQSAIQEADRDASDFPGVFDPEN